MTGGRYYFLSLGIFMSAQALGTAASAPNAAARHNLVFGWQGVSYVLENCLQSPACVGSDRKLIESLAEKLRLPFDRQPVFIFYRDPNSDFCLKSRDVYVSSRIWLSAIQVCEPRLYDLSSKAPLWSPQVSLMEMTELAFLKATPLDESRVAELATRIVELSALRLSDRRLNERSLEQLRLVSLEDAESSEMPFSKLMTPQNEYSFNRLAESDQPCEKNYGSLTTKVSLKKATWSLPGSVERSGWTMVSGWSDAIVECKFGANTSLYRGRYEWRFDFVYRSANRYDGERFSSRFRDLVAISPTR